MIVEEVTELEAICRNPKCQKPFIKRKSNQIYCSDDCCTVVTNARLMRRYHENKARLAGQERYCEECSETKLSRYNEDTVCNLCKAKRKTNARIELLAMFSGA